MTSRRIFTAVFVLIASMAVSGCMSLWGWDDAPRKSKPVPRQTAKPVPKKNTTVVRSAPRPATPSTAVTSPGDYVVKKGDTLYSIAFRHQLDVNELARTNGIGSDFKISIDQRLRLRGVAPKGGRPSAIASPGVADFEWLWPTTGRVDRTYAPSAGSKGLDFTGNVGQPVVAAAPGRVVYSGNALKGYGELIIIKHSETFLSAYGYNRKRHVLEGDVVTAGQPIGELGLGPQNKALLHFEIREKGQPVDPMRYLPRRETVPGVVDKN